MQVSIEAKNVSTSAESVTPQNLTAIPFITNISALIQTNYMNYTLEEEINTLNLSTVQSIAATAVDAQQLNAQLAESKTKLGNVLNCVYDIKDQRELELKNHETRGKERAQVLKYKERLDSAGLKLKEEYEQLLRNHTAQQEERNQVVQAQYHITSPRGKSLHPNGYYADEPDSTFNDSVLLPPPKQRLSDQGQKCLKIMRRTPPELKAAVEACLEKCISNGVHTIPLHPILKELSKSKASTYYGGYKLSQYISTVLPETMICLKPFDRQLVKYLEKVLCLGTPRNSWNKSSKILDHRPARVFRRVNPADKDD
jgi:hypothetical protein